MIYEKFHHLSQPESLPRVCFATSTGPEVHWQSRGLWWQRQDGLCGQPHTTIICPKHLISKPRLASDANPVNDINIYILIYTVYMYTVYHLCFRWMPNIQLKRPWLEGFSTDQLSHETSFAMASSNDIFMIIHGYWWAVLKNMTPRLSTNNKCTAICTLELNVPSSNCAGLRATRSQICPTCCWMHRNMGPQCLESLEACCPCGRGQVWRRARGLLQPVATGTLHYDSVLSGSSCAPAPCWGFLNLVALFWALVRTCPTSAWLCFSSQLGTGTQHHAWATDRCSFLCSLL